MKPWTTLTTSQLAAFLCVTPSAVRHMARDYGIRPVGKFGRENIYHARAFVDTVGGHDRGIKRKRRPPAKITDEGGDISAHDKDPATVLAARGRGRTK